jgi:hypothetical protein
MKILYLLRLQLIKNLKNWGENTQVMYIHARMNARVHTHTPYIYCGQLVNTTGFLMQSFQEKSVGIYPGPFNRLHFLEVFGTTTQ